MLGYHKYVLYLSHFTLGTGQYLSEEGAKGKYNARMKKASVPLYFKVTVNDFGG